MSRRAVALAAPIVATSLALPGCRHCAQSDPGTGINVELRSGKYEFRLEHCPKTGSSIGIYWIKVVQEGPPQLADGAVPECEIAWAGGSAPLFKDKWIYGQTSAAYKQPRCVPLVAGRTYDVYANDSGHQRFSVLADGSVQINGPICP